jgi:hypothetical protein
MYSGLQQSDGVNVYFFLFLPPPRPRLIDPALPLPAVPPLPSFGGRPPRPAFGGTDAEKVVTIIPERACPPQTWRNLLRLRVIFIVRPRVRPRHDALPRRKRSLVPALLRQRTAIAVPPDQPRHVRLVLVPLRRLRLARLARLAWRGCGRRRRDGGRRTHAPHRDQRLERLVRRQREFVAKERMAREVLRGGRGAYRLRLHVGIRTCVVEPVRFLWVCRGSVAGTFVGNGGSYRTLQRLEIVAGP